MAKNKAAMPATPKETAAASGKKARKREERLKKKRRQNIIVCIAIAATLCAAALAFVVIPHWSDIWSFNQEKLNPFVEEWLEINPDYVGWLKIDDTTIDYPVARGSDNERYLTTTFRGEENILGAIFMDYRCEGKVQDIPHVIVYGHQANDTNNNVIMFGGLTEFLDEQYLSEHQTIVFMENNTLFEFEIFSARMSDVNDPAYQTDFDVTGAFEGFLERNSAPADATQIITLSTCVGADNDRRMIVQGALKRTVPVTFEKGEDDNWTIVRPPD